MFDQLGPAVNSGKSPSSMARPATARRWWPKASAGRSATTCLHSARHGRRRPGHHHVRPGELRAPSSAAIDPERDREASVFDRRWERIRQPVVVVGGELTLEMLDLTFNPIAKFYEAPIRAESHRRRVRRRRLRPPADPAARPAEPLDRPLEPRGLPDAVHRAEVRSAVQRVHHLCDELSRSR